MPEEELRVWRAGPATLVLISIFAVAAGIVIPVLAYLVYRNGSSPWLPALLIVLTTLFGWMTIMGLIWWLYSGSPASLGGMKGTPSHWRVLNVNVGDLSQDPTQKVSEPGQRRKRSVRPRLRAAACRRLRTLSRRSPSSNSTRPFLTMPISTTIVRRLCRVLHSFPIYG